MLVEHKLLLLSIKEVWLRLPKPDVGGSNPLARFSQLTLSITSFNGASIVILQPFPGAPFGC